MNLADGDVQAVLPSIQIAGDRVFTLEDHHAIRLSCWRRGPMPWQGKGMPSEVFLTDKKAKFTGMVDSPFRACRKRSEGRAVFYFSDTTTGGCCATFEAISPSSRPDDFIPLRLWLPYGWWTLQDGSEVLFSRDYIPLWKIDPSGRIERMAPSSWVTNNSNYRSIMQ